MILGILGAGNMGGAILKGYMAAQDAGDRQPRAVIYDTDAAKADLMAKIPGVKVAEGLDVLVGESDILILAVKPNIFDAVLPELAASLASSQAGSAQGPVIVSIAAGISIAYMEGFLGQDARIVRVMPNTPAMVGCGMSALSRNSAVSGEAFAPVLRVFEALGEAREIPESLMDTVTGISGSSPAYAYMYMQALIECGVRGGMTEEDARAFAAQATMGAAKMVMANPEVSVEQLRINVCSPGGTTIEAVHVLEEKDLIGIVGDAMDAAIAKSKVMTR